MRPADRYPPHTLAPGPGWADEAACRSEDPEIFFPVALDTGATSSHPDVLPAVWICQKCPVTAACLKWAIDTGERHGVWGARTPAERDGRRLSICHQCSGWYTPRDTRSRYCSVVCHQSARQAEARQQRLAAAERTPS
jgi:WhiB family redox-sensing transcriptional regulator